MNKIGYIYEIEFESDDDSTAPSLDGKVVKQQPGGGGVTDRPFLNISNWVSSADNERGLLGLAFHPNYKDNGYFFVNYSCKVTSNPTDPQCTVDGNTIIGRFQVIDNVVNMNSFVVISEIAQDMRNHNGGQISFAPSPNFDNVDNLYIGLGDGGSGDDRFGNGLNLTTLLGSILRVDIGTIIDDSADDTDTTDPYKPRWTIPHDNPFVNATDSTVRKEIYSYGLRNPWRWSFDTLTGDMYIADVGQGELEEVNYVPYSSSSISADSGGVATNFGWVLCEGTRYNIDRRSYVNETLADYGCSSCSNSVSDDTGTTDTNTCTFTPPIITYGRDMGRSITGGYVYRGVQYSAVLDGTYFYADYGTDHIWGARYNETTASWTPDVIHYGSFTSYNASYMSQPLDRPSTFGIDVNGELYLGSLRGQLYRIIPVMSSVVGTDTPTPTPTPLPTSSMPTTSSPTMANPTTASPINVVDNGNDTPPTSSSPDNDGTNTAPTTTPLQQQPPPTVSPSSPTPPTTSSTSNGRTSYCKSPIMTLYYAIMTMTTTAVCLAIIVCTF